MPRIARRHREGWLPDPKHFQRILLAALAAAAQQLRSRLAALAAAFAVVASGSAGADEGREAIAAPAGTVVRKVHAVGAQIYECKPAAEGLAWSFREPVAALMDGGKTVGRHYGGPAWELADGSVVIGKVVAKAPGAAIDDIPWLKLAVSEHRGNGALTDVTTVQRVDTVGGNKGGPCPTAGAIVAEPYAADYVLSK